MLLKRWVLLLGGLLNGSELIAQPLSLALEPSGLPLLTSCVPLLPNGPVVFHLVLNHGVEDHRNFVRRGGVCGLRPDLGFHSAEVISQRSGTAVERVGGHPKQLARSVMSPASAAPHHAAPGDIVVRAQRQPGNEIGRRGPTGQIPAYLAEPLQSQEL